MLLYVIRLVLSFSIILILIYSCSPRISRHGNFFTNEEFKILKSAKLNKSEILEVLGQPSTKSTFSENTWYYIFFVQKERAVFEVKNTNNNVLIIRFDKKQNVINYNIIKNKTSINIDINSDNQKEIVFGSFENDGSANISVVNYDGTTFLNSNPFPFTLCL